MPELPEVETICRDLRRRLIGQKVLRIELGDIKNIQPQGLKFIRRLRGRRLAEISRLGKLLVFDFGKYFLLIHLKITGQLVYKKGTSIVSGGHPVSNLKILPNKYTRAVFYFQGCAMFFNDQRKFGYMKLVD